MREVCSDGSTWDKEPGQSALNTKPWVSVPSQKKIMDGGPGICMFPKLLGDSDNLPTLGTTDIGWRFTRHEQGGLMEKVF